MLGASERVDDDGHSPCGRQPSGRGRGWLRRSPRRRARRTRELRAAVPSRGSSSRGGISTAACVPPCHTIGDVCRPDRVGARGVVSGTNGNGEHVSNEWDETQQRSSAPDPGAWDPSGSWDPFGTGGQPPQAPFPQPPGAGSGAPRSGPLVAVGMAYLVIVAMVVGVLVAIATTTTSSASSASSPTTSYSGSPSSSTQSTYGAQPVTCTTAPSLQVSGVRGDSSGMVVTMRAASSCSGGQTLTGRWQVRVRSGGTEIAAASFEFGSTGFSIPSNGSASLQLTFPPGFYRAAPSSLSPSTLTTSGTGSSTGGSSNGSTQASVTADSALPPSGGSVDAASADALQRQSSLDSATASQLSDTWSPQLSAKRGGIGC